MKLYNSIGPNPRLVRIFAREKGMDLALEPVDLMGAENRAEPYKKKNPAGQLPCLELDDGTIVSETTVICEYLEEQQPEPALIGATPEERAEARMWTRRILLHIIEPISNGFRYAEGLPIFKDRIRTIPHAADDLKALGQEGLGWLDGLMAGKEFVCGDRYTLADIALFSFLEFGGTVGQPLDPVHENIAAWYPRIESRPAVEASK